MELKNKRERRTKVQLEQDMMGAIERLVCEKGFSDIPLLEFTNEANIDPNVFYFRTWMIYFLDHVHDYDQDYTKDIADLFPDNLKEAGLL